MAGHNRWTQIKRQKGKTDAAKSKLFGKFAKLIAAEVKKSGGNRQSPSLKAVVARAKEINMPNDNIERAIKSGISDKSAAMEKITYEAYGPGGAALVIEALTQNRNKAGQEIKFILSKHGCFIAEVGSAKWAFVKSTDGWTAKTTVELSKEDLQKLESLIDELESNDEVQEVFTNVE